MMSQTGVPALEVSNGFVRVGSLVRIKAGEAKGAVTGFSAPDRMVTIRLEGGEEVTVGAADVARQSPHPTLAAALPTKCPKCKGSGMRDAYLGGIIAVQHTEYAHVPV